MKKENLKELVEIGLTFDECQEYLSTKKGTDKITQEDFSKIQKEFSVLKKLRKKKIVDEMERIAFGCDKIDSPRVKLFEMLIKIYEINIPAQSDEETQLADVW